MKIILLLILISTYSLAQNRWEKLNGPLGGDASVHTFGDTILAALGNSYGTIFYSLNAGETWRQSNLKTREPILDFEKTPDGGIIATARIDGLFKSFDLENWTNIYSDGNVFGFLGKDNDKNIYAGTRNSHAFIPDKIFMSTDNGNSWVVSLDNYYNNISNFLLFKDSTLFAGGDKEIHKKEFGLNNWININLDTIPSSDYTIFSDPSGNIFVNEIKATGSYEAMFNPTDLASGIYIYQLRVNKYTSVKKMQYIK